MAMSHLQTRNFAAGLLPLIALSIAPLATPSAWAESAEEQLEKFDTDAANFVVHVDCSRPNATITRALAEFAHGQPVTISVSGTCHENVLVQKANVTLVTTDGATIIAADPTKATIGIRADDTTIDGLTLLDGISGVASVGGHRLIIRNCTVHGATIR